MVETNDVSQNPISSALKSNLSPSRLAARSSGVRLTKSSRSSGLRILSLENLPSRPGKSLLRVRLPNLKLNPNRSNWLSNGHDLFFQGDPGKPSLKVLCWRLRAWLREENQPTHLYCYGWHLSSLQRAPSSLPGPLPSRPEGISACGPRLGGLESPCLWQG